MSDEMKEQWLRYRKELAHILLLAKDIKDNQGNSIGDYLSEKTQEEIQNRQPFEGIDE